MFSLSPKNLLLASIGTFILFLLIESYFMYYYRDVVTYGIILALVAILIYIINLLIDYDENDENDLRICKYIIVIGIFVLILHPIILNGIYPASNEEVFKGLCDEVNYSTLSTANIVEGSKVKFRGKITDATQKKGSWLLIVNFNDETNDKVAVFYDGELPKNYSQINIYGIVYGKRVFSETNRTYPGIFAFYIEPIK